MAWALKVISGEIGGNFKIDECITWGTRVYSWIEVKCKLFIQWIASVAVVQVPVTTIRFNIWPLFDRSSNKSPYLDFSI